VNDLGVAIKDVHAIRPASVGLLDLVIDRIDENGDRKIDGLGELLSDLLPFGERLGIGDFELERGLAGAANRMRLTNVDDVDVGFVLICLIKLLDRTDRAEERRSRAASEDQHHGLPFQLRKRYGPLSLDVFDREIWRGITHFQFTGPRRLRQRG
jgi:hypothetical protein